MKFFTLMAAVMASDDGDVVVLKDATIKDFIASNKYALVEFYAPWCGHCKQLEPEYAKAATELKGKIPLAKVDATEEKESASTYEVSGFPTLKWFVDGEAQDYEGGRTHASIVDWIKMMTGPAVEEGAPKEQPSSKPQIVLYGSTSVKEAFFDSFASKNRATASFFFVQSGENKITLQHKHEDILTLKDLTAEALQKFLEDNSMPIVGVLDGETYGKYTQSKLGLVWSLFPMTAEDKLEQIFEKNKDLLQKIGNKVKGTSFISYTDTNQFKDAIENMLGVTEYPAFVVQKKAGDKKKFIYDGPHDDAEKIAQFILDVHADKIAPNLKSEPIPETQEAVKVVVGKTLEEMVFTKDKDVMLEVYAPWCGHCKKLEPEYLKVANKLEKEKLDDLVVLAKFDGTANDSPNDSIDYSGFPSIFYVKAGNNVPEKYDGERTAKGIWAWIVENSSHSAEIKRRLDASDSADKDEL